MQKTAHTKRPLLSKDKPVVALCGFASGACFAILGYVASMNFPAYWKASSEGGMRVFTSPLWYAMTFLMVAYGAAGFFGLKLANRCADLLLDRLEGK